MGEDYQVILGQFEFRVHTGVIKSKYSPFALLEKAVFPRYAPWEQRRKLFVLFWSVGTGLFLGGLVVAILFWQNGRH